MAKMFPDEPYENNSNGEVNLFYHLKNQLSDEFIVIHSFKWLSSYLINNGYTAEREVDFLILHENYGILAIEVKGGYIKYNNYGYVVNSNTKIKDPDRQVSSNMHDLRKLILKEVGINFTIGYAVSFPDTLFEKDNLPSSLYVTENEKQIDLLIDKDSLCSLENKIIEIMSYWKRRLNKLHVSLDFKKIINFLLKIDNKEITLNDRIDYDQKRWIELSKEQANYLNLLVKNNLMYISGRAGTGKTLLAIILSRYLNHKNVERVLFLTYNKPISEHIKSEVFQKTDAMTFHSFLSRNTLNSIDPLEESDKALDYIIESFHNPYDVLIIDEAQSLNIRWLIKLKNYFFENNKKVFIFADTIQSLYNEENNTDESIVNDLSISEKYILTRNYRAPEKVYSRLNEFFQPNIEQSSVRELTNQDLYEVFYNSPLYKVRDVLKYLEKNSVCMDEVALLTSGKSQWGIHNLRQEFAFEYPTLTIETIGRYRGMEKSIVILVLTFENDLNELYVAYSRATTQAIVIIHKPLINTMPDFANLLLKSDKTSKKVKNLIQNNLNELRDEYFLEGNKVPHSPLSFQLYYNKSYWVIECKNEMSIEVKILLYHLIHNDNDILVFENKKMKNVKFFHHNNSENENISYYILSFSECSVCNEYSYNGKVLDEYYCSKCNSQTSINRNIIKANNGKIEGIYLLDLLKKYKKILNRIDLKYLEFLDKISDKYNIVAYIELLDIILIEFKNNDVLSLNYLRGHKYLNNHILLKHKWSTYCQHITSKLINNDILLKERQGIYRLNI